MASSPTQGPDFLCIGMGKSGTQWLYDQCRRHPDFWMPPIKEIHYLDREFPRRSRKPRGKRPQDRDYVFTKEMAAHRGQPMNLERYAQMFRFKGDQISGDVTPSYCTLPEELIERVMARFPHLKIILMLRDPVSRAWSHFGMKHRAQVVEMSTLRDPAKFREMLKTSKVTRMGSPAQIYRKWSRFVAPSQFRYYFFEDLTADSEAVSRDVLTFLGSDPSKNPIDATHNRKASRPKFEITADIRDVLAEHFADELLDSARLFGSHARNWPAKYGIDASKSTVAAMAAQG